MFMLLILLCSFLLQRNVTIVVGGATFETTAPPPETSKEGVDVDGELLLDVEGEVHHEVVVTGTTTLSSFF